MRQEFKSRLIRSLEDGLDNMKSENILLLKGELDNVKWEDQNKQGKLSDTVIEGCIMKSIDEYKIDPNQVQSPKFRNTDS